MYILFGAEGGGGDLEDSDALHLKKVNVEVFVWIDFTYFDIECIEFPTS
jgi:hypothetical protein